MAEDTAEPSQITYFHCAPLALAPGSVIEPGNWGRILGLYETANQQIQLNVVREALLEMARQIHAPTRPSRLRCVFVVPTLANAIAFRNQHQRTGVIHEVIPVADTPNSYTGDFQISITPLNGRYLNTMLDFPQQYWTATNPQNPEILFDCPVRVVAIPHVPPLPSP